MYKRGLNKSGVSAVVATVLIIMITVAAVGIIWAVIIPMIRDNLGSSVVCNDADVSIGTSQGYTCYDAAQKILAVQVVKGANEVNVSGLKFTVSSSGSSVFYSADFLFPKGSSKNFYINTSSLASVDQVAIVPILTDGKSSKECSKVVLDIIPGCSFTNEEILAAMQANLFADNGCFKTSDCKDIVCREKSCDGEICTYTFVDEGQSQVGLCDSPKMCDGTGNCVECNDNDDCPAKECNIATCTAGVCDYSLSAFNSICNEGQGTCNSLGNCINFFASRNMNSIWTNEAYYFDVVENDLNGFLGKFVRFVNNSNSNCVSNNNACSYVSWTQTGGDCFDWNWNYLGYFSSSDECLSNGGLNFNPYGCWSPYNCAQIDSPLLGSSAGGDCYDLNWIYFGHYSSLDECLSNGGYYFYPTSYSSCSEDKVYLYEDLNSCSEALI